MLHVMASSNPRPSTGTYTDQKSSSTQRLRIRPHQNFSKGPLPGQLELRTSLSSEGIGKLEVDASAARTTPTRAHKATTPAGYRLDFRVCGHP